MRAVALAVGASDRCLERRLSQPSGVTGVGCRERRLCRWRATAGPLSDALRVVMSSFCRGAGEDGAAVATCYATALRRLWLRAIPAAPSARRRQVPGSGTAPPTRPLPNSIATIPLL